MSSDEEPSHKKRKTGDEADAEPSLAPVAQPLSVPEICARLVKCHPPTVIKTLTQSLEKATPEQISSVQSLLGPLLAAVVEPLHCLRCHKKYFQSNNPRSSCEVKHKEPKDHEESVFEDRQKKDLYSWPCCDREFTVDPGWDPDEDAVCYTAPHTTNADEVDYTRRVKACESLGCAPSGPNNTV
ncbi:hypothetical protein FRC09_005430 [Ceratobasidium sp. 395]|nr:hypothetical protein FRC09_005430 [Ceratobasidium sp. 395]